MQFHPTCLYHLAIKNFLITEAVRGEGGILTNPETGERFMPNYDARAELAPRDIVARGVFAEIAAGRGAFLDARQALGDTFAAHFPTVYASCIAGGIDPARQPIPIAPAVHYHMGGVAVDARGRTSIEGLWAGGEVSCTGAHGANRLASNSLLEAVVYAARIAEDIDGRDFVARGLPPTEVPRNCAMPPSAEAALRELMASHVGVMRDGDDLKDAIGTLAMMEQSVGNIALRNMATTALIVATAAWSRRESRGSHYRTDHPAENPALATRTMTTLDAARTVATTIAASASHCTRATA
jgi:L-aspartate oxidase